MADTKIARECEVCGTGFQIKPSNLKFTTARFCSRACKSESQRGRKSDVRERLFSHVEKTETCWNWTASKNEHGYGKMNVDGRIYRAHRVSYELAHGCKLEPSTKLLHTCDNPACVNPDHLTPGNQLDNMRDCVAKRRHAHGETSYSKLTEEQVRAIRKDTRPQRTIAAEYGVIQQTVSNIKRRIIWAHLE